MSWLKSERKGGELAGGSAQTTSNKRGDLPKGQLHHSYAHAIDDVSEANLYSFVECQPYDQVSRYSSVITENGG